MEKKGDILTQLAVLSDLFQNANMEAESTTVIFTLKEDNLNNLYEKIAKKANVKFAEFDTTFTIKMGNIEYVFAISKNNV